jgi:hypothetical protein
VPRSIRIEYPGAFYHVMARGNRRAQIFRSDHDRKLFLEALGEACDMTTWRIQRLGVDDLPLFLRKWLSSVKN